LNKVIKQAQIAKDTLLQLECGTYDYNTKKLQATINEDVNAHRPYKRKLEARELQEEIVRINRTIHLLERESSTDIEMSEKEEVSPIIANVTNKVKIMQDSLQSMSIQEKNKESLLMKVVYLTHNKAKEDISASRWALRNKAKFTSTNQTQITQEITTITNQSSSRQKPATIITIWNLPEDARGWPFQQTREYKDSLQYDQYRFTTRKETTRGNTGKTEQFRKKADLLKGIRNAKIQSLEMITNSDHTIIFALINLDHLIFNNNMAKTSAKGIKKTVYLYEKHEEQPKEHIVDQIWDIIANSIIEAANICLPKKRLQYSINNRRRQKKEKKSKTYKAIVQLSKWIRKGKKNQNQKIDAALRKEMTLSIREINKKLNVEIASRFLLLERDEILAYTKEHFSSQFKEKKEEWAQVVSTSSNKSAPGASGISYILIKAAGPFPQQIFKEFANICLMPNSILYHPNICNFKNLASKIIIKHISSLYARLNSAGPEAKTSEIHFLQGLLIGRIVNITWDPKYSKLLQGLWKYNLTYQTIELLSPKLNFKAAKTLKKFNIFYANQLILQNDKTLATWSQFKLIKGTTRKGRKPIWFEHLESIVLQDSATRKIKDDLYTSTDLKGLAIPNLQRHIIKKNTNSVLIEHWKELNHLVPSQSKLEKCPSQGCIGISIKNDQEQNESVAGGYEVKWQEIESQVSQIFWNSLKQNLQRKISLEKLTSWLYGIGRKAKWESKSRLTEVRSKRIFKEKKEILKLERLESKGAPSSNMSSQEEK
ncbi:21190_t:CDS:10, partial [Gigaspora margarita]